MSFALSIAEPGEGALDCHQHQAVMIEAGKTTPVKSFVCCNNSPANAKFSITSNDPLVQTIAPCCPEIVGGHCHEFNVVYDARGFAPGTYTVVFHVVAESDGLEVSFAFTVNVTVVPG
jgi:hypothetical protein